MDAHYKAWELKLFSRTKYSNHSIASVIDPSHTDWVLGGIFRDLINSNSIFFPSSYVIPPIRSLFVNLQARIALKSFKILIFSSLTPLQNYTALRFSLRSQHILLWFTHKEGSLTKREVKTIKKAHTVLVHSANEGAHLKKLGVKDVKVVIGAVSPERFQRPSIAGNSIAWVGTPASRKRPWLLLELARKFPELHFRLLGHGWESSAYWADIQRISNLQYVSINRPLESSDFDGVKVFIMTSEIEGGPMPLLESIAAGVRPIVTDCGFVKDVLELTGLPRIEFPKNLLDFKNQLNLTSSILPEQINIARRRILELDFQKLGQIILDSAHQVGV